MGVLLVLGVVISLGWLFVWLFHLLALVTCYGFSGMDCSLFTSELQVNYFQ